MEFVGNALQRTDRFVRQRMDIVEHLYLCRRKNRRLPGMTHFGVIQHIQITGHLTSKIIQLDHRTGGNGECDQYTRYRRMNTRFKKQHPHEETYYIIENDVIHPHPSSYV